MQSKLLAALTAAILVAPLSANDAKLKAQLENLGATNISISDSALPNFKTAVSDQGVVQISNDGRFIIQGQVYEVKNGKLVDLTNQALMKELNALSKEMIVYPAKNEKHVVTVFMDITCHYCHLLFKQIKEYNDLGITVRFLAFPRQGLDTKTAQQMEAIWQAQDPVFALNEAENGKLPKTLKTPKIVQKHYQLGIKFGVTGTPNIVTDKGEVIRGYLAPEQLIAELE